MRLPLRRARLRSESGAELVEFALVLPILLLVLGGIIDFALLLHHQQVLSNAAREGARLAVLPGYTSSDVAARVQAYLREGINDDSATPVTSLATVTLTPGTGPAFQAAQVTVTYEDRYLILGPLVTLAGGAGGSFGTITLRAISTMRVETVSSGT